jgi:hypothetical protein
VAQGGKFGHGFASAGITKGLTNVQLAADNVGEGLGSLVAGLTGGTVSAMTGGKFANGFQAGVFQYLFNGRAAAFAKHVADAFENRMQAMLKAGYAGDGHRLTYKESKWWWRNAGGKTLSIDGSTVDTLDLNSVGLDEWASPIPYLDNLRVHGHVTTIEGRIYDGKYDFDYQYPKNMLNPIGVLKTGYRNLLNAAAILEHGKGTPFEIQYMYKSQSRWEDR